MKITYLCVAAMLGGCTYTPPLGYTESEVSSCKTDYYLGRGALLPLLIIPVVGPVLGGGLKKRDDVLNSCLGDLHSPAWSEGETGGGANPPGVGGNIGIPQPTVWR